METTGTTPKLSVVIICWNDSRCILECIASIYSQTHALAFEIIVSDNASTDDSVQRIRELFPEVRIVQNGANLGFGAGNNVGIGLASGEYILILNPDTIIHEHALEKWVDFADRKTNAGAFGCRTLNQDGTLQHTAQPTPTVLGYFVAALCVRWLGRYSERFLADVYIDWDGRTEREIGFQAGCSLMVRGELLKALGGFDSRFFHQFEDADLCRRIWEAGHAVLFCPESEITHIGGISQGRYPVEVVLETERSKCKYFHKHEGIKPVEKIRYVSMFGNALRVVAFALAKLFAKSEIFPERFHICSVVMRWYWKLDVVEFLERRREPSLGYEPLGRVS